MGLATLHPNLRAAFRERLLTLVDADFDTDHISWEGQSFFPTDGTPYFAESFRANVTRGVSVGNPNGTGGTIEHLLDGTVTGFFPKGKGTLAIERWAGACMVLFRRSTRLSYAGDSGLITNVERSVLYDDGARIGCAVTASILAFTQT